MHYRPYRYPTDYTVEIETPDGAQKVRLADVNRQGARLSDIAGVRRGDKVKLDVLSQQVPAVVLWARSGHAGITFRPSITDHLVDVLRKRVDGQRQNHGVGFAYPEMR